MSASLDRLMQVAAKRYQVELASLRAEDDVFEKLGIDSFQAVELMSELELEFDVEIPDYELQGVRTFGQLAATIDKRR
ncbi:MAG: acyl carrier protein [Deltaproteobacteria bacterium]|nr:acyl carrier protein [Deltaproteobacteria bacterium]MBK8240846.1 acyl carrier protein [Deltaproteobacteria bacterium]MBK8714151.1 acyl carrier protein [Deltaproteobacteria bacterium]MBP7285595.1 acyl carrier protein [Nannocystaceae bacterium]